MNENQRDDGKRKCEWCGDSIPVEALKCPSCNMWRKDIHNDRVLCWTWSLLAIVPMFACLFLAWLSVSTRENCFTGPVLAAIISAFALTGILCTVYWVRVSKKIGTWFWF